MQNRFPNAIVAHICVARCTTVRSSVHMCQVPNFILVIVFARI